MEGLLRITMCFVRSFERPANSPPHLPGTKNSLLAWLIHQTARLCVAVKCYDGQESVLHYTYSSTGRLLGLLIRQLGVLTAMRHSDQLTLASPTHRLCRKIIRRRELLTSSPSPSASVHEIFLAGDDGEREGQDSR